MHTALLMVSAGGNVHTAVRMSAGGNAQGSEYSQFVLHGLLTGVIAGLLCV